MLARSLIRRGYQVRVAPHLSTLQELLPHCTPGYAVVDLNLGSASGLPCIQALRAADPNTLIVVLTGFASVATATTAIGLGACCCLAKPANSDDIEAAFTWAKGDDGDLYFPPSPSFPSSEASYPGSIKNVSQ
ncbi:response regulator transcription factor [Sphingobium sp. SCG-1]|uniref:response regulator transcription factor n=1 Tax=Sphingobium sp. SCG-1 TaxID=2072936 RepID=UPI0039833B14